jgi:Flp pilus assembly protein TadG
VRRGEEGSAALSLLLLGVVLILLSPIAVAASDVPLSLSELDSAAGAGARVAAAQRSPIEASVAARRAATELLRSSRCQEGTAVVEVDVSAFEGRRAASGAMSPGMVRVRVQCTVSTGRRLHIPWMADNALAAEAVEAVDPFRARDAR